MAKPPLRHRLSELFKEYGKVAIVVYAVLYVATFSGFAAAAALGVSAWGGQEPGEGAKVGGALLAGYVGLKALQPLRILATLLLTPAVAAAARRLRGLPPAAKGEAP